MSRTGVLFSHEGTAPDRNAGIEYVLALPIFPEITADQQSQVIDCAAKLLRHSLRRVA